MSELDPAKFLGLRNLRTAFCSRAIPKTKRLFRAFSKILLSNFRSSLRLCIRTMKAELSAENEHGPRRST